MAYIARFYSLETWEYEETGEYPTIAAVKDAACGRVYTLDVTTFEAGSPRTVIGILWNALSAFVLWMACGFAFGWGFGKLGVMVMNGLGYGS